MAAMQGAMERPARLMENLRQARGYLATQGGATKIGVVGWCFGGGWALETALGIPDGIAAAVMYYGRTQSEPKVLAALRAPLLGLFGGKDQGIPVDGVRQMEHELVKLGKNATIVIYPEADHAFANPTGNRYLAGPESSWVTGQSIGIEGGNELMKAPYLESLVRKRFGDAPIDAALEGRIPE